MHVFPPKLLLWTVLPKHMQVCEQELHSSKTQTRPSVQSLFCKLDLHLKEEEAGISLLPMSFLNTCNW